MPDDVTTWLESIGLGKYAPIFAENEIDFRALPRLSEEDLKELGLPLGARRNLQAAIAQLPEQETTPTKGQSTATAGEAERRQLTVMFCDLVGSVALGERMDLEDYRDLLARFREGVIAAIGRYDGFIARHQGDGVLAYFGYPHGHEDDAERAVRAGLGIIETASTVDPGLDSAIEVRIGIATGSVVVGDILEAGPSREIAALGSSPNLAARLQSAAQPNNVLISETTQRLVRRHFDTEATQPLSLKGIKRPVVAYYVRREKSTQGQYDEHLSRMVGREAETGLLRDRWTKAQSGAGQAVLISAEPGVGKSRLVSEFETQVAADGTLHIRLQCSPYHTGSAFHPVLESIARAARFLDYTDDAERLGGLERWVAGIGMDSDEVVPLLAPLMGIPIAGDDAVNEAVGEERRRRTLNTLVEIVARLAQPQAVLLVVEDLHWVDPSTEELLVRLIESSRHQRVLMLITFRPEYRPAWKSEPHITTLTLNHLTAAECRKLVSDLAATLPDELVDQIIDRSDGVPLYAEELVRGFSEATERDGAIPATLRDALAARLDNLGEAKEIAQIASVIGRTFTRALVKAVVGNSGSAVDDALERLVASGLVYRRHASQGESFEFKHALVRDAAYESMLRSRRRALHEQVAHAIELGGGDIDVLAHHFRHGNDMERAVEYSQRAIDRAAASYSLEEARRHCWETIALLDESGLPNEWHKRRRVELSLALAEHSYFAVAPEHVNVLNTSCGIATTLGDDELRGRTLHWLGRMHQGMGAYKDSLEPLERCAEIARTRRDDHLLALAETNIGRSEVNGAGNLVRGSALMLDNNPVLERFDELQAAASRSMCSFICARLGEFEKGRNLGQTALHWAEERGNRSREASTCNHLAQFHSIRGDWKEAIKYAERGARIAQAAGDNFTVACIAGFRGYATFMSGDEANGIQILRDSLGALRTSGSEKWVPNGLSLLAKCLALHDACAEATVLAERAETYQQQRMAQSIALLARALAVAGTPGSDWSAVEDAFSHALADCEARSERPLAAEVRFYHAKVLWNVDRTRAQSDLEKAAAEFLDMGMHWWAQQADQLTKQ